MTQENRRRQAEGGADHRESEIFEQQSTKFDKRQQGHRFTSKRRGTEDIEPGNPRKALIYVKGRQSTGRCRSGDPPTPDSHQSSGN